MLLKVSILRGMQQRRFALNNYVSKKTMVPQGDDRNNEKKTDYIAIAFCDKVSNK